jgi:hypothetical protein
MAINFNESRKGFDSFVTFLGRGLLPMKGLKTKTAFFGAAEITGTAYYNWKKGGNPSEDSFRKVCLFLGCTHDEAIAAIAEIDGLLESGDRAIALEADAYWERKIRHWSNPPRRKNWVAPSKGDSESLLAEVFVAAFSVLPQRERTEVWNRLLAIFDVKGARSIAEDGSPLR